MVPRFGEFCSCNHFYLKYSRNPGTTLQPYLYLQALIDFQTSAQENTITITANEIKRIILRDDSMIDSVISQCSVRGEDRPSGLADTDSCVRCMAELSPDFPSLPGTGKESCARTCLAKWKGK